MTVGDDRYHQENLYGELHLWNKDVDEHNLKMLNNMTQLGVQVYTVDAIDSTKDKNTSLVNVKIPDSSSETGVSIQNYFLLLDQK